MGTGRPVEYTAGPVCYNPMCQWEFGHSPIRDSVRIISKYVLREHLGPLVFAMSALTSLLLLNYIAKQLPQLVGKGLPWDVIAEFVVLSLTLMTSTVFPDVNVKRLLIDLSVIVGGLLVVIVPWGFVHTGPARRYDVDRADWRMPRLALVHPLTPTRGRRLLLRSVAIYLVLAGLMLLWRVMQIMRLLQKKKAMAMNIITTKSITTIKNFLKCTMKLLQQQKKMVKSCTFYH